MKKSFLIRSVLVIGVILIPLYFFTFKLNKSEETSITPSTTIHFEKDTLQLGTMHYEDKKQATFLFSNTGKAPLIIFDVRPSCGCTQVKWDKHPIRPGKSGNIDITFSPNSLGQFIKNIEVISNTKDKVNNLKLSGCVVE